MPWKFCPLNIRVFFWHYFAQPIINSSWILLAVSIFGFYLSLFSINLNYIEKFFLVIWMILSALFYAIVYSRMDYMVDPTYCLTKNGSHYFYDQDCVEEASNHTTCIANVYRNGLYNQIHWPKNHNKLQK